MYFVLGNVRLLNKIATSSREVTTDASSLSKLQVDFQGPLDQVRFDYISLFILYDAHKLHLAPDDKKEPFEFELKKSYRFEQMSSEWRAKDRA